METNELYVQTRRRGQIGEEKAAQYQEACDDEVMNLVNSRQGTPCPMATMQARIPAQKKPAAVQEEPESLPRRILSVLHADEICGMIFGAALTAAAGLALTGLIDAAIISAIVGICGWLGIILG